MNDSLKLPVSKEEVVAFPLHSKVPIKHRSNCPTARQLYEHILATEDFSSIKQNMLLAGVCRTSERADQLLKAWLQWFSVGSTSVTKSFVMLSGPVDHVFHQLLINTKWYFRFCYVHTGVYTHHDPLTPEQQKDPDLLFAVQETIQRLRTAFGDDLQPELKKWEKQFAAGQISLKSVSCVSNDGPFEITPRGN